MTQNDSSAQHFFGWENGSVFVRSLLLGCACGCLFILLLQRKAQPEHEGQKSLKQKDRLQSGALLITGGGITLMGFCLTFLFEHVTFGWPLYVGAGLIAGVCFVPHILCWGLLYARELPESSLLHAALSLMLTALLYCLAVLPGISNVSLIYAGALLLGGAFLARHLLKIPSHTTTDLAALAETSTSIPFKNMLLILWKPLLSGCITAFIIGLVWDPVASETERASALSALLISDLAAPLLAALLVIAAFFFRPRSFSLHIFNDVVTPVVIAILLVVPLVSFDGIDLTFLTGLLTQICFALVAMAVWTSLASGVRTLGERPWIVFSLGCLLFALSAVVGMYSIYLIGINGQVLCLVLLTLFLVLMVVDFALRERPQGTNRERMKEVLEHYLQRRCDALADDAALSAREREVFLYLARGYGQVYIAKELYVSENTIRTHVRHIYAKLGVSSREELLQLIDLEE